MSEQCMNPDCPEHGNSPRAQARRQAGAELRASDEFMDVVRMLAGSAIQGLAEAWEARGTPMCSDARLAEELSMILAGNNDADPVLQGILRGFTALMTAPHEPTKIMLAECSKMKEAPFLVERLAKTSEERERVKGGPQVQHIPGLGAVLTFQNPEQLAEYLSRRGF